MLYAHSSVLFLVYTIMGVMDYSVHMVWHIPDSLHNTGFTFYTLNYDERTLAVSVYALVLHKLFFPLYRSHKCLSVSSFQRIFSRYCNDGRCINYIFVMIFSPFYENNPRVFSTHLVLNFSRI